MRNNSIYRISFYPPYIAITGNMTTIFGMNLLRRNWMNSFFNNMNSVCMIIRVYR